MMKLQDLQRAADNIQIDPDMQQNIIRQVKERMNEKGEYQAAGTLKDRKGVSRFNRIAAAVAGVLLTVGIISIPVRAFVSSMVRERMEEVPKEELQEIVDVLDSQEVGADSFTREYTEGERNRLNELYDQYNQGVFPEGELPQTESAEEADALEFCFLTTTSTFYLPGRELTDEELLQIIDFEAKRNYALEKRYEEEYADEIEARKQEQKEQKAAVVDAGGISEEEAVMEAQKWLEKIYGITGEGLELNHYLYGEDPYFEETTLYMVNWTDFPKRQYYYFYINALDGSLSEASYSSGAMPDKMRAAVTSDELEEKLPELKEKAISFLTDKLGEDVTSYAESYLSYVVADGETKGSNKVEFIFVKESSKDNIEGGKEACIIQYIWDGTFSLYYRTFDIQDYLQKKTESDEALKEIEEANGIFIRRERINKYLDEIK